MSGNELCSTCLHEDEPMGNSPCWECVRVQSAGDRSDPRHAWKPKPTAHTNPTTCPVHLPTSSDPVELAQNAVRDGCMTCAEYAVSVARRHTNPTSEAVEAVCPSCGSNDQRIRGKSGESREFLCCHPYHGIASTVWSHEHGCIHFNETAAIAYLRAALTAAEEGRRKAEAGMEWLAAKCESLEAYHTVQPTWDTAADYLAAARDAVDEGR